MFASIRESAGAYRFSGTRQNRSVSAFLLLFIIVKQKQREIGRSPALLGAKSDIRPVSIPADDNVRFGQMQ